MNTRRLTFAITLLASLAARPALAGTGMVTIGGTADEAARHIARETEIWKKVIVDAGIRFE